MQSMILSFFLITFVVAIYGLVHSLLAGRKAKEVAAVWLGSKFKWYRLGYNVFAAISLLPVLALAITLPDTVLYTVSSPWNGLMILLQLAGAGISLFGARQTGLWHLAGLAQLRENGAPLAEHRLVTDGLYRYVRHPIYTGAILFLWAAPQMTWNGLALRLSLTLYFIIGGMVEEKRLVAEYGDAYRAYRLRTPMLIPGMKKPV
ncbi:MAG: isoprenylcysteine carboxylmethyltransferase family protein [Leptolinea sp.]|jgi:protein-S-isoprenylcysteine O-methyltransferase Ste14|nr:isoprenylcysteine carboxylmethyltransferase family protein [Leptolinea sp.]